MIDKFVLRWEENKDTVRDIFSKQHPDSYEDIVREVVNVIGDGDSFNEPDPDSIHAIQDGDCRGMLIYVIGAFGWGPDNHWYVRISYGSCCGCDTLKAIRSYSNKPPTKVQTEDYMKLALHVVQRIKKMEGEPVKN